MGIHSGSLLLIRCTWGPKNCDESCLRIKPSIASNACSPTQVQTLFKVLWITCHSPRHCTASPICKYFNFQKRKSSSLRYRYIRIRKAEEFSTFYYYTKQQLKRQLQRERKKYNQIKIRRPSENARISNIMSNTE